MNVLTLIVVALLSVFTSACGTSKKATSSVWQDYDAGYVLPSGYNRAKTCIDDAPGCY